MSKNELKITKEAKEKILDIICDYENPKYIVDQNGLMKIYVDDNLTFEIFKYFDDYFREKLKGENTNEECTVK